MGGCGGGGVVVGGWGGIRAGEEATTTTDRPNHQLGGRVQILSLWRVVREDTDQEDERRCLSAMGVGRFEYGCLAAVISCITAVSPS